MDLEMDKATRTTREPLAEGMGSRPPFRTWLLAQAHRDDLVGDLARDLAHDPCGKASTVRGLRAHLRHAHHADPGAFVALAVAADEWRRPGA